MLRTTVVIAGNFSSSSIRKGFCSLKMGLTATRTTMSCPVAKPRRTSTCRSQPVPLRSSKVWILYRGSMSRIWRITASEASSSIRQSFTGTMAWLPG